MRTGLALSILAGVIGTAPPPADAAPAPSGKHWVFFRDKGVDADGLAAALRAVERSYDARAIARRRLRRAAPGLFDARDLPLSDRDATAVASTGAQRVVESRWLNAVSVRATPAQLDSLRALTCVDHIQPVRAGRRLGSAELESPAPSFGARDFYGRSSGQLTQINLPALHALGYTGQGVIIGILDTGFLRTHNAFNQPGHAVHVIAEHDFINNDGNTSIEPADNSEQHRHGTWILGTIGAYMPNELVGGAYNASFVLCKTEDVTSETPVEEDYYVAGLEFIEQHGGDMATSSLGYSDWYTQANMNGTTAVTSVAVNVATQNGLYCVTAAGNAGHDADPATSSLGAPADALQVITVGAVDSTGTIASFSSSGPTADGRIKPEVLAQGVTVSTVSSRNDTGFGTVDGTSLSTPLVASAVACLIQARPGWTVDRMRTALEGTASDFVANGTNDPLYVRGYGILNAVNALSGWCIADVTGDLGVTIDDLLAYLALFDMGGPGADVDNGSFTGIPDGGVTVDDLLYFLFRFDAGC